VIGILQSHCMKSDISYDDKFMSQRKIYDWRKASNEGGRLLMHVLDGDQRT